MKLRLLGFLGFLVAAVQVCAHADGSNWMRGLNGSESLAQFSIPGTHDSGALHEPLPGTAKCQNLSISDQLIAGVRFLDIRCRHIGNSFELHHGLVDQHESFDGVLQTVTSFLAAHPSECVIMSVKEEYTASGNTRSFEAAFDSYVAKNPGIWYLGAAIPTLGRVRGKIVLFRRFGANTLPAGIDASNWPDNASFAIGDAIRVQDNYEVSSNATKWSEVLQALNEAKQGAPNTLYINFASGVQSGFLGLPSVTKVSNGINPSLTSFFATSQSGRYGITLMDFVDAGMCSMIYKTNFPSEHTP